MYKYMCVDVYAHIAVLGESNVELQSFPKWE